jgi:phage/plasmid primase-like uncharacterized protein
MAEIVDLALRRFGNPNRGQSTRHELRFGRHGSVAVAVAGDKAGAWYDHERGEGGWLDGTEPVAPARPDHRRARFREDPERADRLRELRHGCGDPHGTMVEAYLRSRAIEPPYPHSVKAHRLGMVALAQAADGTVLAAQIVYLERDGRRAAIEVPKRTLKAGDGWSVIAAVRFPGRGRLILCEGPETGLSLWKATGRPVWCCLGVANMGRVAVLPRKAVTLARDGDVPGSGADEMVSRTLAELRARGLEVSVATPPAGQDWQDVHRLDGLATVAAALRRSR